MKASLEITPASLSTFQAGMHASQARVQEGVKSSFEQISRELFMKVLNNTPRRTGALVKSGKLSMHHSDSVLKAIISFGDSSINPVHHTVTSEYAPAVHEVYNAAQPKSYKWLERTVNSYGTEQLIAGLSEAIRSALS